MHIEDYMHGGNMWAGMWLFWILVIFGIGVLFYFVNSNRNSHAETPLEILKKRYARGELTKDQYEKMRDDLKRES